MSTSRPLSIVVLGLSLSSSWGNGHATTYRALLRALAERGHDVLFLERSVPWYAAHCDLKDPPYCRLAFYESLADLARFDRAIATADVVIVGSYVPDGIAVGERVLAAARGLTAFYDIDTPVTLAALEAGTCTYLAATQIRRYGLYLSFTGGPTLRVLESRYGAPMARALYCSVDATVYRPADVPMRWHLGYLGTYSADRQPALERLLLEPARRAPSLRFVVAGPQYPETIAWPENVERIAHLGPGDHVEFYSSRGATLNVTRADMVRAGWSPSVRLFEAAACAVPIVSDDLPGRSALFSPGREIIVADGPAAVIDVLGWSEQRRRAIGAAARRRILAEHTSRHRAAELELDFVAAVRKRTLIESPG